ncbi:MAG: hypothetical protein DRP93_07345 [Candidatus Neomarinimicrobiota bacterium]|nr:MAG: hypothetical protein DRP93_07345 [Candidatus Neomarinimicrobiota bacterium]
MSNCTEPGETNSTDCKKYSDATYCTQPVEKLDPEVWFKKLMGISTGSDSIYIKAKETMIEYFDSTDNTLTEREKSEILVKLVGDMTTSMTKSSLDTAYAIVLADRDGPFTLTKIAEDTMGSKEARDKMAADNCYVGSDEALKQAQVNKSVIDGWAVQARMARDDGYTSSGMAINTIILPASTEKSDGTKYFNTKQIQSSINATYAKSYRDSGSIQYMTNATTGILTSIGNLKTETDDSLYGLTSAQTKVAIRQEVAFDDNMRQHAANSSAQMIGMLMSTNSGNALSACDLDSYRQSIYWLNGKVNTGNPGCRAGTAEVGTDSCN